MDESELPTKFVEEANVHLKCPVCQKIYREPVINRCGHTFCKRCVFNTTHCPLDKIHCDTSQLVVNRLVVGQIEDLLIYCRHGLIQKNGEYILDPRSCSEKITFGQRADHEDKCPFALVHCPNSKHCGSFRQKDLEHHLNQCSFISCRHSKAELLAHLLQRLVKFGCTFIGTLVQVEQHSKICNKGELLSNSTYSHDTLPGLEKENAALHSQVQGLSRKVEDLSNFKEEVTGQLDKLTSIVSSLQQQVERLSTQLNQISNSSQPKRRSYYNSTSSLQEIPVTPTKVASVGHSTSSMGIEKWELPFQFKCIGTLRGHEDVVWCLTASRGRLYSAGNDRVIKVWNLDQLSKGCVDNIHGHTGRIMCMAMRGSLLFTSGDDLSLRCWNVESSSQKLIVEAAHDKIVCAMIIAGEYLFTSSFSLIKVWQLKTLSLVHTFTELHHWIRALALNPAKDKLYSGSHNVINIWETSGSFQPLGNILHSSGSVYSLAITSQFIIAGTSGTYNQNIQVYSVTSHEYVTQLCSHINTVTALAVSRSELFLFSASQDSNITIWNLENMLPMQTLSRHQGSVNTLAICGDFVLSGAEDHEIKVFRYFQLH